MKVYPVYNRYLFIFLSLGLLLGACKAKKIRPQPAEQSAAEKDAAERLAAIKQGQVSFNTLAIKSKAMLSMNGNSNEVTINFRIVKDQKIWVSVTAIAGLEVARMQITPDSIFIINRLESTYIKKPFQYISNYTNEQINFGTLQSVLVGNIWDEVFSQKPQIAVLENQLQLIGQSGSLAYRIRFNEIFKVTEISLQDTFSSQQLTVNYANFFLDADQIFPHQIKIQSAAGTNSVEADLKYTKIERDIALDFPFSVPKRFSVKN